MFKKLHISDNYKEKTGYFEYIIFCYWIYISIWGWTQDTEELTEVSVSPTDKQICEEMGRLRSCGIAKLGNNPWYIENTKDYN